jgi:hypothetical protein
MSAVLLREEVQKLEHRAHHLMRSCKELQDEMATCGKDPDFKMAIEENIVLIAKYRARIESLREEISSLEGTNNSQAQEHPMSSQVINIAMNLPTAPNAQGMAVDDPNNSESEVVRMSADVPNCEQQDPEGMWL